MQQDIATTGSMDGGEARALTIGLDVGDRYTHVCALGSGGEVVRERRVHTTELALSGALEDLSPARAVLEAGPRSPWLSRLVAGLGHEVIVANPRQVALIARSHRKTDRLDAEWLARLGRLDPVLLAPIRHRSEQSQQEIAVVHGRGLPPQDGGPHPRWATPGAAAAGGGDRRAHYAHRTDGPGDRGAVRGPSRDGGAAPGHGRGAHHRAHVRADDRRSRPLPQEPGCRRVPRARAEAARLGGSANRSWASASAATPA